MQISLPFIGFAKHLVEQKLLEEKTLKEILATNNSSDEHLIAKLISSNLIDHIVLAQAISYYFKLPYLDLEQLSLDKLQPDLLPLEVIQKHTILPLEKKEQNFYLILSDPTDISTLNTVRFYTSLNIKPTIAAHNQIKSILQTILTAKRYDNLSNEDSSVIKHLDQILDRAISKQASDIHLEPYNEHYRIRFRIDGLLYVAAKINPNLGHRFSSRLKIMATLDIAEKRLPQDGRFTLKLTGHQDYDCRLSTCPTIFGEKLVIRILNPTHTTPDIKYLEFSNKELKIFYEHITLPQGLILVTGPTGSGKTTTLYTAINILNQPTKNISTAEDPVEINLNGINQVEINYKAGLDFATILRAFLRQDPDVIMIGEIRDRETAEIAVKAAHTGHLVLATLHTNSATATLTRLLNMGISPFNLATTIKLIIAQRLVRKLCPICKQPYTIPPSALSKDKLSGNHIEENIKAFRAQGCKSCNQGYRGRIAIFEMIPITPNISNLLMSNTGIGKIEKYLNSLQHQTLREVALNKVYDGTTSLEEVNRVIT